MDDNHIVMLSGIVAYLDDEIARYYRLEQDADYHHDYSLALQRNAARLALIAAQADIRRL